MQRKAVFALCAVCLGVLSTATVLASIPGLGARFLDMLSVRQIHIDDLDALAPRVLAAFGAIFVAKSDVVAPPTYKFEHEQAVRSWQNSVEIGRQTVGRNAIELQYAAIEALKAARAEAQQKGLSITPASDDAARRSYEMTVKLWLSRVRPGIAHWVAEGQLSRKEGDRILALSPSEQVLDILELENEGLYFSKQFDKSILFSVAAPGTSQHLSMLALDVREHNDSRVRAILARHGWYQTVYSDLPHFTYVGEDESVLPSLGLEARRNAGRIFWVVESTIQMRGGDNEITEECVF